MQRGQAIILIGFMGSGKSSVGRCLAAKTGWPLYDTDEMISARTEMSVAEIFSQRGEEKFRVLEGEALAEIPKGSAIIASGGGIVLQDANVEPLRRLGTVVNLIGDEEVLFARATGSARRPLLETENPRATFSELMHQREETYRRAADFEIDSAQGQPDEIADLILREINGR